MRVRTKEEKMLEGRDAGMKRVRNGHELGEKTGGRV